MIVPLLILAVILGILIFFAVTSGLFKGINIYTNYLFEGVLYSKEYEGSYDNLGKIFEEMKTIIKKFKKEKHYLLMGIYYDNPANKKTDPNKCRATIGIFRKKIGGSFKIDEDLESYVLSECNLQKHMIPKVKALYGKWEYKNSLVMQRGISKFYTNLFANLQKPSYCKTYKIEKEKLTCAIELYEKKKINFYVPLEKMDEFKLYEATKQ